MVGVARIIFEFINAPKSGVGVSLVSGILGARHFLPNSGSLRDRFLFSGAQLFSHSAMGQKH